MFTHSTQLACPGISLRFVVTTLRNTTGAHHKGLRILVPSSIRHTCGLIGVGSEQTFESTKIYRKSAVNTQTSSNIRYNELSIEIDFRISQKIRKFQTSITFSIFDLFRIRKISSEPGDRAKPSTRKQNTFLGQFLVQGVRDFAFTPWRPAKHNFMPNAHNLQLHLKGASRDSNINFPSQKHCHISSPFSNSRIPGPLNTFQTFHPM